jgi:uncharacterized protein involved in exopolysaccharide biosynthesis
MVLESMREIYQKRREKLPFSQRQVEALERQVEALEGIEEQLNLILVEMQHLVHAPAAADRRPAYKN